MKQCPIIAGCPRPERAAENGKAGRIKLEPNQLQAVETALQA